MRKIGLKKPGSHNTEVVMRVSGRGLGRHRHGKLHPKILRLGETLIFYLLEMVVVGGGGPGGGVSQGQIFRVCLL